MKAKIDMDILPVSAFIICKNEAKYLGPCLDSLSMCEEIIVVDSGSTDNTLNLINAYISNGYPINLIHQDWLGYARQKQFALEQCNHDWVISLDADERLDKAFCRSFPDLLKLPSIDGWYIRRRLYFQGVGYLKDRGQEDSFLRLFKRKKGAFGISRDVHESVELEGSTSTVKHGTILHFRPLSLSEQLQKESHYSSLKAEQLYRDGRKPRYLKLLFNPMFYFLKTYLKRGAWRAGWQGFIHAQVSAIYSFMTEAKLYQLHLPPPEEPEDES